MALTNHERVNRTMELLRLGLGPYVDRELTHRHGEKAELQAGYILGDGHNSANRSILDYDVAALLKILWKGWNEIFGQVLGQADRSLVSELRDHRNRWAHQKTYTSDDTDRCLDSAERLLTSMSASEAEEVRKLKMELRRLVFDEQARGERRRSAGTAIEGSSGLKPWREVVTPHRDVASGSYQQAEFAADLWQVHIGEGSDEYRDPAEFYRRTFLTESLRTLLTDSIRRMSGVGGDPVVQLQTNFGGGKTHSMLALYHLFSGATPGSLAGIEPIVAEAGVEKLPTAKRVVIVGNKISPGNPSVKSDGTVVRTLWGELAWQLGGKEAFAVIAADDELATSPGDALRLLLTKYGPTLILIDEWVAYARMLHDSSDLPGGSFETHFTFAQSLTEAAKAVKNCLLVISLPASDWQASASPHVIGDDIEVGGQRGREALDRLRNVIGRIESSWRPATAEEGFEIVRRRLFEPITDPDSFKDRDVVARAFADLYRSQQGEFPPECRDADYERKIIAAYPIHPEVFERLYSDWSTLVKFQRTRGVLRLMAAVIHSLWEKGDRNPLILPAHIPIDDPRVQTELTRYLPDNWTPVIEKDVDGPQSLPLRLDSTVTNLGKLSAARRVARVVYIGSAPTTGAAHRGIEDRRVKLGCMMPGEPPGVFGDALRRLASEATFLYSDGPRYWYSTQPTVTKLADDRAEQLRRDQDKVNAEIERRIKLDLKSLGDFRRVHALPSSSQDVADDRDARLVVLSAEHPYQSRTNEVDCPAEEAAASILEKRGNAPRIYRNALVFVAADKTRLQELDDAIRKFLAWESILSEKNQLDLTPLQVRQAEQQRDNADSSAAARLPETYMWLLTPSQSSAKDPIEWKAKKLKGSESIAVRASKALKDDSLLYPRYGGSLLRLDLDRVPLWRPDSDHVPIRELADHFARYVYLPRLSDPSVLIDSIRGGVSMLNALEDGFAYAERYDDVKARYVGLKLAEQIDVIDPDGHGLIVKADVARRQRNKEEKDTTPGGGAVGRDDYGDGGDGTGPGPIDPPVRAKTRFYGTVELDPTRMASQAGKIAEELVMHLSGLVGASVTVTLEIQASVDEGIPEGVQRIVGENASALKFKARGFE